MPWDSQAFGGIIFEGFILVSLQPFPGNYLALGQFQSLCDVIKYFEVVFLEGSELDETTLVLGNG